MNSAYFDINKLQTLLFERRQILALLDETDLWQKIPLQQRFAIVESAEFVALMGQSFTEQTRDLLESEIEAMRAVIH